MNRLETMKWISLNLTLKELIVYSSRSADSETHTII